MVEKTTIQECSQLETREIPTDWNCEKIGLHFELKSGNTPRRTNSKFFKGSIPWITSTDLNRGIISDTLEKISKDAVKKTNLEIFPKDTLVIALYGLEAEGTRGNCGILDIDSTINQACMAFKEIGDIKSKYLFYFYSFYGNEIALKFAQGTKQQNLYKDTLEKICIHHPKKIEEEKIIQVLTCTYNLIKQLENLIQKKKNIKQGTMQELLTGKRRIIEFNEKRFSKDWDFKTVSQFGEVKRGAGSLVIKYVNNAGIRLIQINDFFNENPVFVLPSKEIMKFAIDERDILFAGTGTVGASYIPKKEWIGLPHSYNAPRIRVKKEYSKKFLLYSLQSEYVAKQMKSLFVGGTQKFLDINAISNFKIATPPTINEQNKIAQILSDMDADIKELEDKKDKYIMIKNGMMQKLLTGEIRLI